MYESFFGLAEPPFSLSPDARFLWLSDTHDEGLAALRYGITSRKGFVLLTGEVGAGKTTLLRAAFARLPVNTEVVLLTNTEAMSALDLLKYVAAHLALGGRPRTRADYVIALHTFLLSRLDVGWNTVLVIDEAQNLNLTTLEQVRLLSNLETERAKLLQIVLAGQPELRQKLADPKLRPLRQRIAIEHHVDALRPEDVLPYLSHRIQVAGGRFEDVFEPGVEAAFQAFAAGVPRLLNVLADQALLAAFARGQRPASRLLVESKARELAAARAVPPWKDEEGEVAHDG